MSIYFSGLEITGYFGDVDRDYLSKVFLILIFK